MLERVSLAPELFKAQWGKEFAFAMDGSSVVIRDLDGNPAMLTDATGTAREAQFTEADIKALTDQSPHKAIFDRVVIGTRASGGGASGPGRGATTQPDKPAPKPAPVHFGLS